MMLSSTFLSSLSDCNGFCKESFVAAHQSQASVSIRLNNRKVSSADILFSPGLIADRVPWCSDGMYLKHRPSFTLDPLFHAGAYYVQEASSMFIHHILHSLLDKQRCLKALDLCASPGGKSTLLASLPFFNLILANEVVPSRIPALVENIIKWGSDDVFVSNSDPREIERLGDMFDVVLVDAPCSGSGLFRKDTGALDEWSPEHVSSCAIRQKKILDSATKLIKEGGYLLYSTCSFSKEENEDVVDHLIASGLFESVIIPIETEWGIVVSSSEQYNGHGYRFYPDQLKGEGFYCAVLRKTTGDSFKQHMGAAGHLSEIKDRGLFENWINLSKDAVLYQKDGEVFMCEEKNISDLLFMKELIKLKRSGLRIGSLIRNELIPDHELAMSMIRSDHIPRIGLDIQDALRFLRRETIEAHADFLGWGLVHHQELVLGWVKVVNGKLKNHYPMPWRILMRG